MLRIIFALTLTIFLSLSTPAWSQDSLADSWSKVWGATVEAVGKTAEATADTLNDAANATAGALGRAADATSEALDRAKEVTLEAVERGAQSTLDTVKRERGKKKRGRPAPREFLATVQRVPDGNTIVVRTADFDSVIILLYGIDAPEGKQPGGDEATAALRPIQGRLVTVLEIDVDRYSRTVGLVYTADGTNINLDLVAQGWAWHYPEYCQEQPVCGEIKQAEEEARAAKRGLWAGEPVAPWEWRKR